MADLSHDMGGDLQLSPTGNLALASGTEAGRQRVLRRLLTNPGAYIWQLDYGAGLGAFVGQPNPEARMRAVVRAQMLRESAVASSPAPSVDVLAGPDGTLTLTIAYTDAVTGANVTLSVPVSA